MKYTFKKSILISTFAILLAAPLSLQANERSLDAHEHGVSTLKIAQENNTMLFELEAPGNDIVGFEHGAENDAQKSAIASALGLFKQPEAMFMLPAEAGCVASGQHAEFEAEEDHAGFHVTWTMTCENPSKANAMEIKFLNNFERAEEIEVEAIGNAGQVAIEVEKNQTNVDLSQAVGG